MDYHRFNIGMPTDPKDLNAWWEETVERGVITAGFEGKRGDEGEQHLRKMVEGDWVLAYAKGHGFVGAGLVLGDDTYELHKRPLEGSLSTHRHERGVNWQYVIPDVTKAISHHDVELSLPRKTRERVRDQSLATDLLERLKRSHVPSTLDLAWWPFPSQAQDEFTVAQLQFERDVVNALDDTSAARQARLQKADKLPEKVSRVTDVYVRNPDVVAEVLYQANGVCGRCRRTAPFVKRSSGTPYLEVHHHVRLADGGEDTVENAVALCPNCHRELHFGL